MKAPPQDATFNDLYQITFAEWRAMPTLHQGHTDNLKYESPRYRVWVSRMTLADYNGDRDAYMRDRFTIEEYESRQWFTLDRYGRRTPR